MSAKGAAKGLEKIARKYARALFEALELSELEGALELFRTFSDALQKNPNLLAAINNPTVGSEDKQQIVSAVMEVAKAGSKISGSSAANKVTALVKQMIIAQRSAAVFSATEIFEKMVLEAKKLFQVRISTASALSAAELEQLMAKIGQILGGKAEIQQQVDASLIGGLKMQFGDKVLDASVKGQLARLASQLV